ncbi:MAG: DUF1653 domain-containing protein [Patescibacteria group bacterium]
MKIPTQVPERGYYYHYKHDPTVSVNNYAYELVGVGCHTEDNCRPEDANMVIYRPLYPEASVYVNGQLFDLRPLEMWMETVTVNGETVPRFKKITDPQITMKLDLHRKGMYS